MKMKNVLLGAMMAIGCGVGFNASAVDFHECCRILQEECEYFYPNSPRCANIYNNCVARRHCVIP